MKKVHYDHQEALERMISEIEKDMSKSAHMTGVCKLSPQVRLAFTKVPRHLFVPEGDEGLAYLNEALSIGKGQTISQPFIVALMTELLCLKPKDKVLEIGTGSGYQAAILAELGAEVYTVEIIESLSIEARSRLKQLAYSKIHTRISDGSQGWESHAPYGKIIVTAACEKIPSLLINQLGNGGVMVIPLGAQGEDQALTVVTKDLNGKISQKEVLSVAFVPFTSD